MTLNKRSVRLGLGGLALWLAFVSWFLVERWSFLTPTESVWIIALASPPAFLTALLAGWMFGEPGRRTLAHNASMVLLSSFLGAFAWYTMKGWIVRGVIQWAAHHDALDQANNSVQFFAARDAHFAIVFVALMLALSTWSIIAMYRHATVRPRS